MLDEDSLAARRGKCGAHASVVGEAGSGVMNSLVAQGLTAYSMTFKLITFVT